MDSEIIRRYVDNCRHMRYLQLVDNKVEVNEYTCSCGIQLDRKGAALLVCSIKEEFV